MSFVINEYKLSSVDVKQKVGVVVNVEVKQVGNVVICKIVGRLDIASVSLFEEECNKLLKDGHERILLDCENLEYIDSECLRVLIKFSKEIKLSNKKLIVVKLNDIVQQIFEISGFLEIFPSALTVEKGINIIKY